MTDENPYRNFGVFGDRDKRLIAEAEAKAKQTRQRAHPCAKCGRSMLDWGARTMHYSCDPAFPLAGLTCICRRECSATHWGDGPTPCDPGCEPCRKMRGKSLTKRGS